MRLKNSYFSFSRPRTYSISEAMVRCMNGNEFGSGQLETVTRTADNACAYLANLVQALHAKGLLTDEEVLAFVSGYEKADE